MSILKSFGAVVVAVAAAMALLATFANQSKADNTPAAMTLIDIQKVGAQEVSSSASGKKVLPVVVVDPVHLANEVKQWDFDASTSNLNIGDPKAITLCGQKIEDAQGGFANDNSQLFQLSGLVKGPACVSVAPVRWLRSNSKITAYVSYY